MKEAVRRGLLVVGDEAADAPPASDGQAAAETDISQFETDISQFSQAAAESPSPSGGHTIPSR